MTVVYNHDIIGIYNRLNRFIEEGILSVSSSGSEFNGFDQARALTYLDALIGYKNWVTNRPQLDLPETHPREYPLEAPPTIVNVENESINDLVVLFVVARDELINSQSARDASGLKDFDNRRFTAVVDKAYSFLSDYVETLTPLDLPESTPKEIVSGPGKKN